MSKHYQFRVYDLALENWLESHSNISEFIRKTLDDARTGKNQKDENIEFKIKRQQLLKLQLGNWKDLMSHGLIMEEAKAILLDQAEMENPTINSIKEMKNYETGLNGFGMCSQFANTNTLE